jgi:hypothetical protein
VSHRSRAENYTHTLQTLTKQKFRTRHLLNTKIKTTISHIYEENIGDAQPQIMIPYVDMDITGNLGTCN